MGADQEERGLIPTRKKTNTASPEEMPLKGKDD
jgi:hypothetical protein